MVGRLVGSVSLGCLTFLALSTTPTRSAVADGPGRGPQAVRLELGGGFQVPFDPDHREVFGEALSGGAGLVVGLGDRAIRGVIDLEIRHASGVEFRSDGTFEFADSRYWVVPLGLGLRTSVMGMAGDQLPFDVQVGAGLVMAWTRYEPPAELPALETSDGFTTGGYVELRPELRMASRWGLYLRNRISVLARVDPGGDLPELNHGGVSLQLGASVLVN